MGFDHVCGPWDTFSFGANMTLRPIAVMILLAALGGYRLAAQTPQPPITALPTAPVAKDAAKDAATSDHTPTDNAGRADAYYYFTMGHLYEQQYEATSR